MLFGTAAVLIGCQGLAEQGARAIRNRQRPLMGTRFQVFIDESDRSLAGRAADAAFERAAEIGATCIAGPEHAIASIGRWGGRAVRVVTRAGGEYQVECSEEWPR